MSASSPISITSVKNIGLAFPIPVGVVTLIRLSERIRSKKFGFDDGFAALSLCVLITFVVALFVHLGDSTQLSYTTRVAIYYVLSQGFYGVVWSARLSILCSIIRITPNGSFRHGLYGFAASYVIIWIVLFSQVFWVCEREPGWKDTPAPQCALGKDVAIAQLITDIYADSVLIIVPLRLLWNLVVSKSQRNRLLLVFSSSVATSVASLAHAFYVLRVGGLPEVFVAIIEICVSLLVCNVAVIVGLIARFIESRLQRDQLLLESHSMSQTRFATIGRAFHSQSRDDPLDVMVTIDIKNGTDDSLYTKENVPVKGFGYLSGDHALS